MLLSVIIPIYNRPDLLPRALASVLAQTVTDLEILVVDDASDQDILSALDGKARDALHVIRRNRRGGAAAARNTGLAEAKGAYIAFLDSDDQWTPTKLERQLALFERDPDIALTCTGYDLVRDGKPTEIRVFERETYRFRDLAFGCGLSPGTTLCARREFFDLVGPFDEKMPRFEDWEWLLRASRHSEIGIVNESLATVFNSGWPAEREVHISTTAMARAHGRQFLREGVMFWLQFWAALFNERAVAAFRAGRYARATWFLGVSLLVFPLRRWSYFGRVAQEALRALRRRSV